MDFSYFNLDILSSDAAEVEKVNLNIFFFLYAVKHAYCDDVSFFFSCKMQIVICIYSICFTYIYKYLHAFRLFLSRFVMVILKKPLKTLIMREVKQSILPQEIRLNQRKLQNQEKRKKS